MEVQITLKQFKIDGTTTESKSSRKNWQHEIGPCCGYDLAITVIDHELSENDCDWQAHWEIALVCYIGIVDIIKFAEGYKNGSGKAFSADLGPTVVKSSYNMRRKQDHNDGVNDVFGWNDIQDIAKGIGRHGEARSMWASAVFCNIAFYLMKHFCHWK